jgi:predicted NBD/HSP70 family sugar kinase
MGGWQQLLGVPARTADQWRRIDLAGEVMTRTDLPVTLLKDTAAACVAELVVGRGGSLRNFLYVFVDTFIGGGLVLDGHLRPGSSGNAGAIGSMPLGVAKGDGGPPAQLLAVASLFDLERRYAAASLDASAASDDRALAAPWRAHTDEWLADAARAIAQCIVNAACLLDLEGVILDGSFARGLRERLLQGVETALGAYDWEGVQRPQLMPGSVGGDAQALGGALLPLHANFAPDRGLFLKD